MENKTKNAVDYHGNEAALLGAILSTTPDHIYVYDRQKRYQFVSDSAATALGQQARQMLGKTWQEAGLDPRVMELFEKRLDQVLSSGQSLTDETWYQTVEGSRCYEYTISPITASDGAVTRAVITVRDITHHKEADRKLKLSHGQLKQQVAERTSELSRAVTAVKRESDARQTTLTRLTAANRLLKLLDRFNGMLPRAEDQAQLLSGVCRLAVEEGGFRMAWVGQVMADDPQRWLQPVAQFGFEEGYLSQQRFSWGEGESGNSPAGQAVRGQLPVTCADLISDPRYAPWRGAAAQRGYASAVALPIKVSAKMFGVLTIYAGQRGAFEAREVDYLQQLSTNIGYGLGALQTRIKLLRTVEQARQSRARYRAMVVGQVDSVCHWLPDTTLTFVNDAFCRFYGEQAEDLMDRRWITLFAPRDRKHIAAHFRSLVERPRMVRYEYLLTAASGEERWQEWVDCPITDGQGRVVEFQSVGRDITDRKQAEAGLKASQAALLEQKAELERKNVALRELLTQIEQEKLEIRRRVSANVERLVMPALEQLRVGAAPELSGQLDLMQYSLNEICSRFGLAMRQEVIALSPREVEICNMIRHGLGSKEICQSLHISLRTVETHRAKIRKKLGLAGRRANLATYLRGLA